MSAGPDVLRLAGFHADCTAMLRQGQQPPVEEIRLIVKAVEADKTHPYWDSSSPAHNDAVAIVADLRGFALPPGGNDE